MSREVASICIRDEEVVWNEGSMVLARIPSLSTDQVQIEHVIRVSRFMFLFKILCFPKIQFLQYTKPAKTLFSITGLLSLSTEGCSKLKRSVDMTSSGMNGLNIRILQVPYGTGPGVRRSKRPLLASRTRCKCPMETLEIR